MNADDVASISLILFAIFSMITVVMLISFAISAVVCYLLYSWLREVPQEHRKIDPPLIWLLLIPCFAFVWNFFVFIRIPESFKSYFDAHPELGRDVGDCGRAMGI